MELALTAVFEEVPPSEGGGFAAYCEELPGANTQGDTLEEARENLRDAIHELLLARESLFHEHHTQGNVVREKIGVIKLSA